MLNNKALFLELGLLLHAGVAVSFLFVVAVHVLLIYYLVKLLLVRAEGRRTRQVFRPLRVLRDVQATWADHVSFGPVPQPQLSQPGGLRGHNEKRVRLL